MDNKVNLTKKYIYVDPELWKQVKVAAAKEGMPVYKWLAQIIRDKILEV
ncbi:hypothetical protein ACFLXA_02835 [Chloroflexota bacterium]